MKNPNPFNKNDAIDFLVGHLKKEIEELNRGYEHARHTSIDAPGRMESRYDTMGVEAAWRADGLSKNMAEKIRAINLIESVRDNEIGTRVEVGAAVGLGPEGGEAELCFLILPAAGGVTVDMEGVKEEILSVTPEAPVARALIGRRLGDLVAARPATESLDKVMYLF